MEKNSLAKPTLFLLVIIVIVSFMLLSCSKILKEAPTLTPTPSVTASITSTVTSTPTATATYTSTPTPDYPLSLSTKLPERDTVILADNVGEIIELARWGKGYVWSIEYSQNGDFIATVSSHWGIYLYDAKTLEEINAFFIGEPSEVSISPNGEFFTDGDKLWRVSDGVLISKAGETANTQRGATVAFSPDETIYATSVCKDVELRDINSDEIVGNFTREVGLQYYCISSILFSPDGNTLALKAEDTIYMWDVENQKLLFTREYKSLWDVNFASDGESFSVTTFKTTAPFEGYFETYLWNIDGTRANALGGGGNHVAFSPDGKYIAAESNSEDNAIMLYHADGTFLNKLEGHTDRIGKIVFSPDSKVLASSGGGNGRDQTVRIWRVSDGELLHIFKGNSSTFALAFSPDGKTLAFGAPHIQLWDVETGKLLKEELNHSRIISVTDMSLDGEIIVSHPSWGNAPIQLQRVNDGTTVQYIELPDKLGEYIIHLNLSANGETLAFIQDGNLFRKDISGGELLQISGGEILRFALSPDGKTIASCSSEERGFILRLWDSNDGTMLRELGKCNRYDDLSFSSDGEILVSVLFDYSKEANIIYIWQVNDGSLIQNIQIDFRVYADIVFSSDNKTIAYQSGNQEIKLWDVESGTLKNTLRTGKDENAYRQDLSSSISFSPDGNLLAAGNYPGEIFIWRVSDGKRMRTIKSENSGLEHIEFSADGTFLVSVSGNGSVSLWGLP